MGSLPSHPTRRREFLDCGCINLEIRIRIQFVFPSDESRGIPDRQTGPSEGSTTMAQTTDIEGGLLLRDARPQERFGKVKEF